MSSLPKKTSDIKAVTSPGVDGWAVMSREFGTAFHGLRARLAEVAVGEASLRPEDAKMFARLKELGLR